MEERDEEEREEIGRTNVKWNEVQERLEKKYGNKK
jgi:hypothetical protein